MSEEELQLPAECWELVFKFLNPIPHFEPLSLVSTQFLSITNLLRTSLTISNPTLPFLPNLFRRFSSITSLNITGLHHSHLHTLLLQLSRAALPLQSLNLSGHPSLPSNGLRAFARKIPTLKSLTCSHMTCLRNADLLLIADCFSFLEHLDLSFPENNDNSTDPVSDFGVKALSLALPKLRRVNLSGNYFISDTSILSLCKNCELLGEIIILECHFITQRGIASAIRERPCLRSFCVSNFGYGTKKGDIARPYVTYDFISALVGLKGLTCLDLSCSSISDELLCCVAEEGIPLKKLVLQGCCNYTYVGVLCLLSSCQSMEHLDLQNTEFLCDRRVEVLCEFLGNLVSINVSGCRTLTDLALFALIKNCPLLNEIKMEATDVGKKGVDEELVNGVVNYRVKSLYLGRNSWLRDESLEMIASVCPSLEVLDLSSCCDISEGVVEVLRRCSEVRNLSLAFCSGVKLKGLEFEVPKLEELNLSGSRVDDETLSVISKYCRWLLHLDLENCYKVTANGVREVVDKCRRLREINLVSCCEVEASVVAWMVFSRPSLRRIMAPPSFDLSGGQRELLLRHGCIVSL
ncbi:F-box/LRR-repeat protein 20-like [Vigna umbellata]|uniref:F-box/LRR-repeat protein 20-like n=1 Tax=Vigna umbellata TaxID=87088 RepID=UPI001F5E5F43|nr:F-box/LRR-repeat protein 20-like [Vigna umbellata]